VTGAQFDGLGGEVDIDLLADYIGGALAGTPDESVVAALIADEPAWARAFRDLSAGMTVVGAELARMQAAPMPADLAARLDSLLTAPPSAIAETTPIPAELAAPPVPHLTVVRDADAAGDGAPGVREKKTPRRERGNRPGTARRLRWATPIAIAAGFAAFVGFGLDYLAGRDHTGAGSGSADSATAFSESQARDNAAPAAGAPTDFKVLDSGADYNDASLTGEPAAQALSEPDARVSLADGASGSERSADRSTIGNDPLARLRPPSALRACLDAIQRENGGIITVHWVDYARYEGAPAVVVRFTAANGGWAWASGPSCGTPSGSPDTLGSVPVR
jgi:hypothetical protein